MQWGTLTFGKEGNGGRRSLLSVKARGNKKAPRKKGETQSTFNKCLFGKKEKNTRRIHAL